MSGQPKKDESLSDVPLDLTQEREAFLRTFMRKGVELTEELLSENEELRQELAAVRDVNARLRAQVASDDAIRDLLRTVDHLEAEKRGLLDRSQQLEADRRGDEGRYEEIEQELNDLANLYIASYQLHASLSVRRVVRHLKDTLGQLVGAEAFLIYVVDPVRSKVVPIGHEGVPASVVRGLDLGEGPTGEACLTGIPRIREELVDGSVDNPLAVIPLVADGRPVGAITIVGLLVQKTGWASVDRELFNLLGAHAGTALIAANLYAASEGPVPALRGVCDHIAHGLSSRPPSAE